MSRDRALRQTVRELLHDLSVTHVDEANDGREALCRHALEGYHLIVTEWDCAPLDGIHLVRAIREAGGPFRPSLLLLSREQIVKRTIEALQCGANALVALPLDPRAFSDRLRRMIAAVPAQTWRTARRPTDVWSPGDAAGSAR